MTDRSVAPPTSFSEASIRLYKAVREENVPVEVNSWDLAAILNALSDALAALPDQSGETRVADGVVTARINEAYEQGRRDARSGEPTDAMVKRALAVEYEDGVPVSRDIGFGMMRQIIQAALPDQSGEPTDAMVGQAIATIAWTISDDASNQFSGKGRGHPDFVRLAKAIISGLRRVGQLRAALKGSALTTEREPTE